MLLYDDKWALFHNSSCKGTGPCYPWGCLPHVFPLLSSVGNSSEKSWRSVFQVLLKILNMLKRKLFRKFGIHVIRLQTWLNYGSAWPTFSRSFSHFHPSAYAARGVFSSVVSVCPSVRLSITPWCNMITQNRYSDFNQILTLYVSHSASNIIKLWMILTYFWKEVWLFCTFTIFIILCV